MKSIKHKGRLIALVILVVVVAISVVLATRPTSQATQIQSPLLGQSAPLIKGKTLSATTFTLSQERGHYTYVNFFASWCPPCQVEEPALVAFQAQQSHKATGAKLVSVIYNDSISDAMSYVAQWGIEWPVVADSQGAIANRYGVTSPPLTFLVSPKGKIVGTWSGPVTLSQLDELIRAAKSLHFGNHG
jgi:cytochrome c biogenesis protein CcmG/thiol:disulfide interchange protein DsbE